jgi:DNA topoisomerase-2
MTAAKMTKKSVDKTTTPLSVFYGEEAPAYAAYDNLRKIASYIDGLKLSHRKVMYTLFKKFPSPSTENKTSRLASSIAETTEYIHGEGSLCAVLNTMAADYVASNNFPLITGHGSFGTRFTGLGSAAAPRYTYCSIAKIAKELFHEDDRAICKSREFEGTQIEPEYFMPIFPVLFLNGTEGLSSGWRAQVYPRDPLQVIKYIKGVLNKEENPTANLFPYFKGFKGKTLRITRQHPTLGQQKIFVNYGVIKKTSNTSLHITEIPITYTYASYMKVLTALQDAGKIKSFDDQSDPKTDTFEFIITVKREFFNKYKTEKAWLAVFKLEKILTEHLNSIDSNGRVREFGSVKEMIDAFIEIRLKYYGIRKEHLINKFETELMYAKSQYVWCKGIVDDTIKIRNVKKDVIVSQLKKIKDIVAKDNSYDYLINMPLSSITKEKMVDLLERVKLIEKKLADIKVKTAEGWWLEDLASLEEKKVFAS